MTRLWRSWPPQRSRASLQPGPSYAESPRELAFAGRPGEVIDGRIALKRPFRDGTVAVDLNPLSMLCRLVALVPAPRFHTVRYFGVNAVASGDA